MSCTVTANTIHGNELLLCCSAISQTLPRDSPGLGPRTASLLLSFHFKGQERVKIAI